MSADRRRGWCPDALRPMTSGDGLLVRLRMLPGDLDIALAARIAGWADQWGNGAIDLSQRGNLQLRGVTPATLPALQAALAAAGLLTSVPNLWASPLAGRDPAALLDLGPVIRAVETRLEGDPALRDLPAKFGFLFDDGGRLALGDSLADVRFEACRSAGAVVFRIRLDGAPEAGFGPAAPADLPELAARLARIFVEACNARGRRFARMRELVAVSGAAALASAAGLAPFAASSTASEPAGPADYLGVHRLGEAAMLGLGLPYGRIAAGELGSLAAAAAARGATAFRLTPWRALLVLMPSLAAAESLAAHAATACLIQDPADPRCRIAACPGAPGCGQAERDISPDLPLLAAALRDARGRGILLHVSGCAKGCAHPRPAPVTLVGTRAGYDLVAGGPAEASPAGRGLDARRAAASIRAALGGRDAA